MDLTKAFGTETDSENKRQWVNRIMEHTERKNQHRTTGMLPDKENTRKTNTFTTKNTYREWGDSRGTKTHDNTTETKRRTTKNNHT